MSNKKHKVLALLNSLQERVIKTSISYPKVMGIESSGILSVVNTFLKLWLPIY